MKHRRKIGEGVLLAAVLLTVLAACVCVTLIRRPAPAVVAPIHAVSIDLPRLNLNTATAAELRRLPGIGDVLAERIVAYRGANGGFASIEELTRVVGIGKMKLDAIRERIRVE